MNTQFLSLNDDDRKLIVTASELLRKRYNPSKHTVASVVLCGSGRVYTGVNIESSGIGPCAEPIAIGAALTAGETQLLKIVAVCKKAEKYEVLSPCGNCRQILLDYAPDAMVILNIDGEVVKTKNRNLLPGAYTG